jgi:hypothetical protein
MSEINRMQFVKWVGIRDCFPTRISDNGEVTVVADGKRKCFRNVEVGLRQRLRNCLSKPEGCATDCTQLIEPSKSHHAVIRHQEIPCDDEPVRRRR